MSSHSMRLSTFSWAAALLLAAAPAAGHNLELTRTLLLLRADGTYQLDMTVDLDALALGAAPTTDSAELAAAVAALSAEELTARIDHLERYFQRRVRLRFDGEPSAPQVSFPDHGTALARESPVPTVLGLTARLAGRVPEGALEVTFRASRSFPPVHLTILDERALAGRRELLESGSPSSPYPLDAAAGAAGRDALPDLLETAGRYLALGFWHIVPEGLDHILFVLGLFLLAARWRPLLWQVSAFTAAHTLTLALSTYGVVSLPATVVEPLIALSIAYVAIENVLTPELETYRGTRPLGMRRPLVVFAFGLVHGLGFAGVLGELGLPQAERLPALLAFNAGVELGQLSVLLAAFAAVGWLRNRPWYRRRVVVPASLAIAAVGLYWAVERVFGG